MSRKVQQLVVLLLAICAAGHTPCKAAAADPAPVPVTTEPVPLTLRERVLRMTEFLDTMLPGTLGRHNMTLHFSPKSADVRDREYVRFPVEIRYGATDRLELVAGVSPFVPNPINSGRDHRWGPGEAKLGAWYDLEVVPFFYDKATVGIETRVPLGKPPVQLNDHYTHVRPFIAMSRQLRSFPSTTFYTNLSYDRSEKLTDRNPPPPEVVRRHTFEAAPGLLYKPGEFGYFGEYRFRHFQEPGGWRLGHESRIGVVWDVPLRRSANWNLPGKWQIELAYKFTKEEGQGDGHGISTRINWRTTLRQVLDHVSNGRKK